MFRGEFTVDWASAVAGHDTTPGFALVDAIGSLAAKSLLTVDTASDTVRYRLLDTTRVYALEKLVQGGEPTRCAGATPNTGWRCSAPRARRPWGRRADLGRDTRPRHPRRPRARSTGPCRPAGTRKLAASLVLMSHPLAHYLGVPTNGGATWRRCLQHAHLLDARVQQRLHCWRGALLGQTQGCPPALSEAFAQAEAIGAASTEPDVIVEGPQVAVAAHLLRRPTTAPRGTPHCRCTRRPSTIPSRASGRNGRTRRRATSSARTAPCTRSHCVCWPRRPRWSTAASTPPSWSTGACRSGRCTPAPCGSEGLADEAEQSLLLPLACARHDLPHALCHAYAFSAVPIALWRGDLDAAASRIDRLVEQAERHALGYWAAWGRHLRQVLAWRRGDAVDFPAWSQRLAAQTDKQADLMATLAAPLVTDRCVSRVREGRVGWCAPEVLRASAMQSLRRGADPAAVREAVGEALALARRQGMLAWELRAATSLARLWAEAGEPARGRDLLASVCERFTEGFGTADWRAAQRALAMSGAEALAP